MRPQWWEVQHSPLRVRCSLGRGHQAQLHGAGVGMPGTILTDVTGIFLRTTADHTLQVNRNLLTDAPGRWPPDAES